MPECLVSLQYYNFCRFGVVKGSFTYRRDLTEHMNFPCGTIHIGELLLQMSHVAWSVCLSFCWANGECAKTAEPGGSLLWVKRTIC